MTTRLHREHIFYFRIKLFVVLRVILYVMTNATRHIAFLLLLLVPSLALPQGSTKALLNIRGTVFENQTLQPMEGAGVKLYNERGIVMSTRSKPSSTAVRAM